MRVVIILIVKNAIRPVNISNHPYLDDVFFRVLFLFSRVGPK